MDGSLTSGGVVGAVGRLSANDTADGSQLRCASSMYPERPGEPDCKHFLRTGTCDYGRNCRFNHPRDALYDHGIAYTLEFPERVREPDCEYYLKTSTCKYGSSCKYNHPKGKQADVWMNILGLPMRQDAKPCPFYMRMGVCGYGHACKFHHPQPSPPPVFFPVLGPPATFSSSPYLIGSSLQPWQSYPPAFIYSPQDWPLYMGNAWPASASHVVTAPPSYDFPQRPGRPECRYFISHGTCRYGSNCRYNHPAGRISQVASIPVAPPRLPSGPRCESSSSPSSEPPQAKPTAVNDDEPPKENTPGGSPDRSDSFPHSCAASNQNDSD